MTGLAATGLFVGAAPASASGGHLECSDSSGLRIICDLGSGTSYESLSGEVWYEDGSHLGGYDGDYSLSIPCQWHHRDVMTVSYFDGDGVAQTDSLAVVCERTTY